MAKVKTISQSGDENRRRQEERTANIERRLQEAIYDVSDIPEGDY